MKLGSLFDGIAGFPLAASIHGIIPIWASEIEPFCIKVSKKHFPNMIHLGDICGINGGEIEPVDAISFGSPCQDLSVAGKRAGIEGDQSHLFFEAVDIIREMQEATGGQYPTFALWENVPGAFSSNGGRDFAAVLQSLVGAEVCVPENGWTSAGVAFGPLGQVAWRVLDAQHWGVPQRRRRIYALYDTTGERAGEILFESQSLPWDTAEGREAGQETAAGAGDGINGTEYLTGWDCQEKRIFTDRGVAPTLAGSDGGGGRTGVGSVAQCVTAGTGRRYDPETETLIPVALDGGKIARTLTARADSSPCIDRGQEAVLVPVAFPEPANTLLAKANMSHRGDTDNMVVHPQVTEALCASGAGMSRPHAVAFDLTQITSKTNRSQPKPQAPTLHQGGGAHVIGPTGYAVRRLIPIECLRLQGFPDWWLDIEGASDTAMYKATGNSIATPPVEWIFGRMKAVFERQVRI